MDMANALRLEPCADHFSFHASQPMALAGVVPCRCPSPTPPDLSPLPCSFSPAQHPCAHCAHHDPSAPFLRVPLGGWRGGNHGRNPEDDGNTGSLRLDKAALAHGREGARVGRGNVGHASQPPQNESNSLHSKTQCSDGQRPVSRAGASPSFLIIPHTMGSPHPYDTLHHNNACQGASSIGHRVKSPPDACQLGSIWERSPGH
uniref:Uncharacterized protein n=1 Tax=Eutreptiella gymnastica TaxID=73025 RepID=A0A7S4GA81_9EUGL